MTITVKELVATNARTVDGPDQRAVTRVFYVNLPPEEVLTDGSQGLPSYNELHPTDPSQRVDSIRVDPVDGHRRASNVVVRYSSDARFRVADLRSAVDPDFIDYSVDYGFEEVGFPVVVKRKARASSGATTVETDIFEPEARPVRERRTRIVVEVNPETFGQAEQDALENQVGKIHQIRSRFYLLDGATRTTRGGVTTLTYTWISDRGTPKPADPGGGVVFIPPAQDVVAPDYRLPFHYLVYLTASANALGEVRNMTAYDFSDLNGYVGLPGDPVR